MTGNPFPAQWPKLRTRAVLENDRKRSKNAFEDHQERVAKHQENSWRSEISSLPSGCPQQPAVTRATSAPSIQRRIHDSTDCRYSRLHAVGVERLTTQPNLA